MAYNKVAFTLVGSVTSSIAVERAYQGLGLTMPTLDLVIIECLATLSEIGKHEGDTSLAWWLDEVHSRLSNEWEIVCRGEAFLCSFTNKLDTPTCCETYCAGVEIGI